MYIHLFSATQKQPTVSFFWKSHLHSFHLHLVLYLDIKQHFISAYCLSVCIQFCSPAHKESFICGLLFIHCLFSTVSSRRIEHIKATHCCKHLACTRQLSIFVKILLLKQRGQHCFAHTSTATHVWETSLPGVTGKSLIHYYQHGGNK